MLSDLQLKYILIGRNNKIGTTVPDHLLIGPLLFFRFLEKQLLKIADDSNSICFV